MRRPTFLIVVAVFMLATGMSAPESSMSSTGFGGRAPAPQNRESARGTAQRASVNVILLTVDSMRPDHLGVYGYDRPTTPRFDAFAEDAAVFPNAIGVSAWTFPGVFSLLTGVYPARHGLDARGRVFDDTLPTLQSLFYDAGYHVPDITFLTPIPGLRALQVDARWPRPRAETEQGGALLDWLRTAENEPFFAWYHYRSLHLPYRPQPQYEELFGPVARTPGLDQIRNHIVIPAELQSFRPEERRGVVDLYDSTLKYFDDFFGELVDTLETTGLSARTIVVITADHGEELFEHGLVGHASTTQYAQLYDEVLRIPLIIRVPKLPLSSPSCQVSQIDVMPTVLSLAGLAVPEGLDGRDLSGGMRGGPCGQRPLIAESILGGFQARNETAKAFVWALRTPGWKLIVRKDLQGNESRELYDLAADPEETTDLVAVEAAKAEELGDMLEGFFNGHGGADYWVAPLQEAPPPRRGPPGPASAPQIMAPTDGARLSFADTAGVVGGEWTGSPTANYVIEYDVGEAQFRTAGTFQVTGNRFAYGPMPLEIWESLVQFNPWRVRVYPADYPDAKSAWITFALEPSRRP